MNNLREVSSSASTGIAQKIEEIISQDKVVLFMKGTPEAPMCGFSATVVKILQVLNVPFTGVNVLESPEVREGIKQYSDWPTIPQLYISKEFIGGCDIVHDLYSSKELEEILSKAGV